MPEARALSQDEIDALLNQIPADAVGNAAGADEFMPIAREQGFARAIKTYDFRRPDKFSKEQWQTLQAMHDSFSRLAGAVFSSRLRTLVTVRLSSIEQSLYQEWQSQVPAQTVCYVISMPPLGGNIVVEFNFDVAAHVLDRVLGGTGVLVDRGREIGDIETMLLRSFGSAIGNALRDMWANVVDVDPAVQDIGVDAGSIQIASPNDVVFTAFYEVAIGNQLGAMSICTPYTVVEPVASFFTSHMWLAQGQVVRSDERTRRRMEALIATAPLDISVQLGSTDVTVRQVMDLRVGDTIVLDQRAQRPLQIRVNQQHRFNGRPGMVGNRIGMTVTSIHPRETDADDLVDEGESLAQSLSRGRLRPSEQQRR